MHFRGMELQCPYARISSSNSDQKLVLCCFCVVMFANTKNYSLLSVLFDSFVFSIALELNAWREDVHVDNTHCRKTVTLPCYRRSAKTKKYSVKTLPSVILDKQHTTSTVSVNRYLPSVFYRALGKWFAECQIWHSTKKKWFAECFSKIHSAKDYCLPSVFLELHSANLFFKEKILSIFQFNSCHTKHS